MLGNGVTLVAAALLVNWSEDPVQVDVCLECGAPWCSSGGAVVLRRTERFVFLAAPPLPSSEEWDAFRAWPAYFPKGLPAFTRVAWGELRSRVPRVPPWEDLKSAKLGDV